MRDLGLMGESTFSLWCGDAGLIPNGSRIDKTGWDFYVEFPFHYADSALEIHKAAFECKVQVKATDKNERKLPIILSNLRRLITAQMPAFFVFIEFDGKDSAQKAYLVHVDNDLITKVLKRLHELGQSEQNKKYNKRTMIIHYDESQALKELNGNCLKATIMNCIGSDISQYIADKKSHLESTGFENGFAQLNFTTEGEKNLKDLIDLSLGIVKRVEVANFRGVHTRFGIASKSPFVDAKGGKLEMPDLKPNSEGVVTFKEDKLSAGVTFKAKLFISPFNAMIPDKYKKFRVEGEFFDLKLNPYTGEASHSFSFGEGVRLPIRQFRDAIKLLSLLSTSGKTLCAEMLFDGYPPLTFYVGCKEQNYDFSKQLKALECAVNLVSYFDAPDILDISFNEVSRYEKAICHMNEIISSPAHLIKAEFSIDGNGFDVKKEVACIFLMSTPIGSYIFGILLVLIGNAEIIKDNLYRLITKDAIIEKKIISEKNKVIQNKDLVAAIEIIEQKYDGDYSVVTMFDIKC